MEGQARAGYKSKETKNRLMVVGQARQPKFVVQAILAGKSSKDWCNWVADSNANSSRQGQNDSFCAILSQVYIQCKW